MLPVVQRCIGSHNTRSLGPRQTMRSNDLAQWSANSEWRQLVVVRPTSQLSLSTLRVDVAVHLHWSLCLVRLAIKALIYDTSPASTEQRAFIAGRLHSTGGSNLIVIYDTFELLFQGCCCRFNWQYQMSCSPKQRPERFTSEDGRHRLAVLSPIHRHNPRQANALIVPQFPLWAQFYTVPIVSVSALLFLVSLLFSYSLSWHSSAMVSYFRIKFAFFPFHTSLADVSIWSREQFRVGHQSPFSMWFSSMLKSAVSNWWAISY